MKIQRISILEIMLFSLFFSFHASAYYDPGVQRWINRDPIRELGHFALRYGYSVRLSGRDRNLASFTRNAPTVRIDPLGLTERDWPLNGKVCNSCDDETKVYILVEGEYFTLPAGKCTADNPGGVSTDVDGVWICEPRASGTPSCTFYRVNPGLVPFNACGGDPPGNCPKWNGDPKSKNSPTSRGGSDDKPPRDPPIYRLPQSAS